KIGAVKMFFIVSATDYGPASLILPLEDCFSVFQNSGKRKSALEECFSSFQGKKLTPVSYRRQL
ncbi:hypothetical protein, partial [Paenibacillus sp. GP183]|uniref:hypothetical protein n=1 Tax=Paenibacillus sp. GP183 TaxID=1882751 RepID=UPI001C0E4B6F